MLLSKTGAAFTQNVLRGVIRRRLGHLKNKKVVFSSKQTTILSSVICRSVNATLFSCHFCKNLSYIKILHLVTLPASVVVKHSRSGFARTDDYQVTLKYYKTIIQHRLLFFLA